MYKKETFTKKEYSNNQMNIIFLDIDGVIQPYSNQFRFDHDMNETINYLCEKYNTDIYRDMDIYDVCAAYYDWDEIAIGILKKIVQDYSCRIVIHSGWKESNSLEQLRALFKFYDMEDFILDVCASGDKTRVIKEYLNANKDKIYNYVILEDLNLTPSFGWHFCLTRNVLNMGDYYQICTILTHNYDLNYEKEKITYIEKGKNLLSIQYKKVNTKDDCSLLCVNFYPHINYLNETTYKIICNELIKFAASHFNDVLAIVIIDYNTSDVFKLISGNICTKIKYNQYSSLYFISVDPSSFAGYQYFDRNRDTLIDIADNLTWN